MTRDEALWKVLNPVLGVEPLHRILSITGWPEHETLEVLQRLVFSGRVRKLQPWPRAAASQCCYMAVADKEVTHGLRRFQGTATAAPAGHGAPERGLARAGKAQREQPGARAPSGVRRAAAGGGRRGGRGLGASKGAGV